MSDKLVSIQALRGIAALSVLFGHAQTEAAQMSPSFEHIRLPWGAGVDLFFVLSGFVMVLSSSRLFARKGSQTEFLTQRFIRVAPLYWIFTSAMIVATIVVPHELETARLSLSGALSSFAFLPWPRWDGAVRHLLSLGWTLNYEMFFYALFALALFFRKGAGLAALLITLLLLVAIGASGLSLPPTLAFWTDSILLEFAFGVLIGWLYTTRTVAPLPRLALVLAPLAIVLLVSAQFTALPRCFAQGIPAALLLAAALLTPPPAPTSFHARFADWIGASSYSLYLAHPFAFGLVKLVWPLAPGGIADWLYVSVAAITAIVAGVASYRLIERPLLHALRGRTKATAPPRFAVT